MLPVGVLKQALIGFQGRGFADVDNAIVVTLSSLKPFFFKALKRSCASRTMLEHKTPESNKSVQQMPHGSHTTTR
jgi:hypothetical protein